jgi:PAS domain S-box-containing protein
MGSVAPNIDERTVFRSMVLSHPDALLLVNAEGTIVLANPVAYQLFGYPPDELVGCCVDELVPAGIRPRHAAYRSAYAQAPRSRPMGTQMDLVAQKRDGSEVMVEIALSPLQEHGLPYVVAAVREVSEYPRVKQALKRARYAEHLAQFGRLAVDMRSSQDLLSAVPAMATGAMEAEACAVFLSDGRSVRVGAASGLDLSGADAVGGELEALLREVLTREATLSSSEADPERQFRIPTSWQDRGLDDGLAVPLTDRGRVFGAVVVLTRGGARFGEDGQRFLESLANLLATALQRSQTEEQLQHAQRLDSVGKLTGGIAHDFNNLLTVIGGNLQVLEERPAVANDSGAAEMVGSATRATRRAAELTGKLLAFSRRQVLQPERIEVGHLLNTLRDMLCRTLDQRIVLQVDVPPDCPPCKADAGQLEAALLNIAINARDAMPSGGRLTFAAFRCAALPLSIGNDGGGPANYVEIAVSDSGKGMPDSVRERAFEPFFTTKEAGRGTGLGLSTVYGFARQSRGAVSLESTPGQGTTVRLYLPCHDEATTSDDSSSLHAASFSGLHVLLVEDDADVRHVLLRYLAALRCDVTEARSAEDALQYLNAQAGIHLLLSDIALGSGLRGTDLAAIASERLPGLPILLISGFSQADQDTAARWTVLRKPFRRESRRSPWRRPSGAGRDRRAGRCPSRAGAHRTASATSVARMISEPSGSSLLRQSRRSASPSTSWR